jgi:hypothetical protein
MPFPELGTKTVTFGDIEGSTSIHDIAEIISMWGYIEYHMYRIFEATDPLNWTKLAADFFSVNSLSKKRQEIIRRVSDAFADDEYLMKIVTEVMTDVSSLAETRNLIVHGVWSGKGGNYVIQPLRWNKAHSALQPAQVITASDLIQAARSANFLNQRLASVGCEVMVGEFLNKRRKLV